jgi:hypothetical protein
VYLDKYHFFYPPPSNRIYPPIFSSILLLKYWVSAWCSTMDVHPKEELVLSTYISQCSASAIHIPLYALSEQKSPGDYVYSSGFYQPHHRVLVTSGQLLILLVSETNSLQKFPECSSYKEQLK